MGDCGGRRNEQDFSSSHCLLADDLPRSPHVQEAHGISGRAAAATRLLCLTASLFTYLCLQSDRAQSLRSLHFAITRIDYLPVVADECLVSQPSDFAKVDGVEGIESIEVVLKRKKYDDWQKRPEEENLHRTLFSFAHERKKHTPTKGKSRTKAGWT